MARSAPGPRAGALDRRRQAARRRGRDERGASDDAHAQWETCGHGVGRRGRGRGACAPRFVRTRPTCVHGRELSCRGRAGMEKRRWTGGIICTISVLACGRVPLRIMIGDDGQSWVTRAVMTDLNCANAMPWASRSGPVRFRGRFALYLFGILYRAARDARPKNPRRRTKDPQRLPSHPACLSPGMSQHIKRHAMQTASAEPGGKGTGEERKRKN